jgi:hypothetical protein
VYRITGKDPYITIPEAETACDDCLGWVFGESAFWMVLPMLPDWLIVEKDMDDGAIGYAVTKRGGLEPYNPAWGIARERRTVAARPTTQSIHAAIEQVRREANEDYARLS